jgi:hypothetical protein
MPFPPPQKRVIISTDLLIYLAAGNSTHNPMMQYATATVKSLVIYILVITNTIYTTICVDGTDK